MKTTNAGGLWTTLRQSLFKTMSIPNHPILQTPPKRFKRLTQGQLRLLRDVREPNASGNANWHTFVVAQDVPGQQPQLFVPCEFNDSLTLGRVVDFMTKLADEPLPLEGVCIGGDGKLSWTPLGRKLRSLLRAPHELLLDRFHEHWCHPYVAAYLGALDKVKVHLLETLRGTNEEVVAEFALILKCLRAELSSKKMRHLVQKFKRNSMQCYDAAMAMVRAVTSQHSKVLSLRLDLSFRSADPVFGLEHISNRQAKEYLAKFLHHLRRKAGLKLLAYCWAMEYAPTTGCHFHMWILLNGHHHQDANGIGDSLGAVWSSSMTAGEGRHFVCNKNLKRYAHLGVGMLHRDRIDWKGLHKVAFYMTKVDFYLHYDPRGGGRTFGRTCVKTVSRRACARSTA